MQYDDAPAPDPAAAEQPPAVRRVSAAQQQLEAVGGAPLAEQIEIYDDVHATLQDALAELDGA
ncbi:MAG: hypothetical protein QOG49_569 [Frankiaceae bacterium]|jgi:hypothetical protein|nr:hypothetical protein [Frankiaceae bacterium]